MSILVQISVDEATLRGLEWLCRERDVLPGPLIAEIVDAYVREHAAAATIPDPTEAEAVNGLLKKHAVNPGYFGGSGAPRTTGDSSEPVGAETSESDRLAAILVERLGWAPDDPRIVNRRRSPLDAIVGIAGDAEPVDDIDAVIYGR